MDMHDRVDVRYKGHWLRRVFHMMTALIPVFYYWYLPAIALRLHITPQRIILMAMALILILDGLRLLFDFKVYGQRHYESGRISSAVYALFSIGIVLLFSPPAGLHGAGFGLPLICAFSFADPLMGELRILKSPPLYVLLFGFLAALLIWIGSFFYLGTPGWVIPWVVSVSIFSENYLNRWIDDNISMLLCPLFLLLIFR